jgi:hypothetical protein
MSWLMLEGRFTSHDGGQQRLGILQSRYGRVQLSRWSLVISF